MNCVFLFVQPLDVIEHTGVAAWFSKAYSWPSFRAGGGGVLTTREGVARAPKRHGSITDYAWCVTTLASPVVRLMPLAHA